jgi:hypothetical protein
VRTTIAVLLILSIASLASARTWRVNTAGTGDAPTLHAAMDSALSGDIVLVEAGSYDLPRNLKIPWDVQLSGESGPALTVISRNAPTGFNTVELLSGASMRGVHVRGNTMPVVYSHGASIVHCILESLGPTLVQCAGPT